MLDSTSEIADRLDLAATGARLGGVAVTDVSLRPIPYDFGSPATAGIFRAEAGDHRWFVKVLRDIRLWPGLAMMPEVAREHFVGMFPWRGEVTMHEVGLDALLPAGSRLCRLLHTDEPDAQHVVMWTEWIDLDHRQWSDQDFAHAGWVLGHLAASRREGQAINDLLPAIYHHGPDFALSLYVAQRVTMGIGSLLAVDEVWRHPTLLEAARGDTGPLRAEMSALLGRLPSFMAELGELPQTQPHGDASPQNLLISRDDPDTLIITDWGFGGFHAIGMDCSQLVVGLSHAGLLDPHRIPGLLELAVDAYTAGLADGGWPQPRELVHRGALLTTLCRSALTALPLESLDDTDVAQLTARIELTRVLLALAHVVENSETGTGPALTGGSLPRSPHRSKPPRA